MYDGTASKIVEAFDIKPSLRMPCPMRNNGIDESSNHDAIDNVSDKVATLRQRSGDQGSGSGRKNKLEKPLGELVG